MAFVFCGFDVLGSEGRLFIYLNFAPFPLTKERYFWCLQS